MKEFLNKNFLGIIVIILAVLLYFQRCNNDAVGPQKPDTVLIKTEYIPQPPVIIPSYIPAPTSTRPTIIIPPSYNPSKDYESLLKQYKELVDKHLETKTYNDSIQLQDSTGAKVGVVNLKDVVSENEIKSREPSYQLSFPRTTITIREPYKPRNQLYLGGGILGTETKLVSGAKIGAYWKNKKDQLYGISAHKTNNYPLIYSIEGYWKIRLRK